jgi:hypothetical protein
VQTTEIEHAPRRSPILRRAVGGLVVIAAAALAIHLIVGLLMTIFWGAVIAVVVVAILWGLKTILW